MRRLAPIIAATLVVAACSPAADDNGTIVIDDDLGVADVGEDTDTAIDLPLLEGELVAPPTRDDVDEVRISDAGEFLFVVQDDQVFAWLGKEESVAIEFATWPDMTRPDDGPPSADTAFDDTYFWFLSEYDGGWNLAGVEHFLGSASPLFGQPIIIIDLGPIQKPRGIERYGERFVIPTDGLLVIAGENIATESVPIEGTPVFDRFDDGLLGLIDDGAFVLQRFDATDDSLTVVSMAEVAPLSAVADGGSAYVFDEDSLKDASNDEILTEAAPADGLIADASSGVVAWTSTDGIRVYDGGLRRIDAADVDSLVVDDTHVWWSNAEGIWRARID